MSPNVQYSDEFYKCALYVDRFIAAFVAANLSQSILSRVTFVAYNFVELADYDLCFALIKTPENNNSSVWMTESCSKNKISKRPGGCL